MEKVLLQQRGIKSRDENGLFEDIGGKVEDTDKTFRDAMIPGNFRRSRK